MQPNHIILDMTSEQYHAHEAISNSGLTELAKSAAHYRHYRENGSPDTDALNFGSAFHTMLLEPEAFDSRVQLWSGQSRATTKGKEEYANAVATGKLTLKIDEHVAMKAMCSAINAHVSSNVYLSGKGKVEASLFWTDAETGVQCRCRPDWMRDDGVLVDLKTTRDASPEQYERHAFNYRYWVQAAFYMQGYEAVTGKKCPAFAFVAVEKEQPYGCTLWIADESAVEAGKREVRRCLERYATAKKTGKFECYPDVPLTLRLPACAEKSLTQGATAYV